jgi:hypothetical protein
VHTTNGFVNILRRTKMSNDIKVLTIEDQEDGSATVTLDLDAETYHKIFEYGFVQLIMKGIESEEIRNAPIRSNV